MTGPAPVPAEIRRVGLDLVVRDNCPCAECRETPRSLPVRGQGEEIYAVQIGVVGRYAISIQWSDGHDTGIYSYQTLRSLCPCDACATPAPEVVS